MSPRNSWIIGAVAVVAVLAFAAGWGTGQIVDEPGGSGKNSNSEGQASSDAVGKCDTSDPSAVENPAGGAVSVVEHGAFFDKEASEIWFGAVLENTSSEIAYHVAVEFSVLDEDCNPIDSKLIRKSSSLPQQHQTVPVVSPGKKSGLGGFVKVRNDGQLIGGVKVELGESGDWRDANQEEGNALTDRAYASKAIAGIGDGELNVYLRVNDGGRFSSSVLGVGAVFRNGNKEIVGGAPVVKIEGEISHLDHKTATFKVPKAPDGLRDKESLSVEVVEAASCSIYLYPEYVDSDTGTLASS